MIKVTYVHVQEWSKDHQFVLLIYAKEQFPLVFSMMLCSFRRTSLMLLLLNLMTCLDLFIVNTVDFLFCSFYCFSIVNTVDFLFCPFYCKHSWFLVLFFLLFFFIINTVGFLFCSFDCETVVSLSLRSDCPLSVSSYPAGWCSCLHPGILRSLTFSSSHFFVDSWTHFPQSSLLY